ncbi:MAG: HPr family phosphocarrier protein [Candidatus Hodarchaeales archaeon]
MKELTLVINHPAGLHARPAAVFVETVNQFSCDIEVSKLGKTVNAKSLLGVLTLEVHQGSEIKVTADGEDEEEAIAQIKTLIESDFKRSENASQEGK